MYFWSRLKWRLRHGWRKSKLEAELDEEMGFHLEMLRQEAGAAARREFGNVTRMREESRAQWGFEWVEGVAKDLRFAGRGLKREWPSTLAAIGALSLGIGFSIAVFTL